jgi:hydrogenase-4 component E
MSHEFAGQAIDVLAVGMIIMAVGIIAARTVGLGLLLFALQSILLATAGLNAGLALDSWHILVGAALVTAVKAVAAPLLLWTLLRRLPTSHAVQASVSSHILVALSVTIALLTTRALDTSPFVPELGARWVLPAAVTIMLIGILIMVSHRQAMTQVVGFLVLENGMALAALTALHGMPLIIELGVFLDLLLAVFVAFVYTQRMHVLFGSLDTETLRSLRG